MRGRAAGSTCIRKLAGNYEHANFGIVQTCAQKCKMGSLAAPHFVHSSARVDAEGAKRGSLDRSDLKTQFSFDCPAESYYLPVLTYRPYKPSHTPVQEPAQ